MIRIAADDEYTDLLGGAVGGIAREDISQIVANLVTDREQDLELWIRPERAGHGYTVEWTTLEYDHAEHTWRPHHAEEIGASWEAIRDRVLRLLHRLRANNMTMPTFDVDREQITVFAIEDTYLFKHYFEQDDIFDTLRPYYNEEEYRFEVPADAFAEVQETLEDHFYDPVVVHNVEEFCVVKRKYTDHPDVLFKASVLQRSQGDYHVFLMKDQRSMEQAVNNGATRLKEADVGLPF